jgi:transposase
MAFFTAHGVGEIIIFTENCDAKVMKKLVEEGLIKTALKFFPNEMWYHLHDNDKKFHSNLVHTYCHNHGITNLDFPAYSPDLNPIENLWPLLKAMVENHHPKNENDLMEAIKTEWKLIDPKKCRNIVNSMPKRCKAVIANSGGKTGY